ncbi:hypothetical protein BsWGS_27083 [Bradybaena similaris]
MRTRNFSRDSSSSKKMVYHHDIPSATTRLPGGVTGGFLSTSRITGSCYVIEEEQPSDCQLDDNGNNQLSELVISSGTTGVGKDVKFVEKDHYKSDIYSDNNNVNHVPRKLFPSHDSVNKNNALASSQNVSSCEHLDSTSSNGEADFQSQRVSSKTSFHDLPQQHTTSSERRPHLKSGHLVLILPEHQVNLVNPNPDCPYFSSWKTLPPRCPVMTLPPRCPVMVKIYDRGFEKYAIISCTRRQLALPPICLKLKHSYVTQSTSNPSCFSVVVDSSEGKTFTFEATNPDMAQDWMQALALTDSSVNWNSRTLNSCEKSGETAKQTQYLTTHSKTSPAVLNLSDLTLMPVLSECVEEEE